MTMTSTEMNAGANAQASTQPTDQASVKAWPNVKYAIYFTSFQVKRLLGTPEARKETLAYFAPIRAGRFYIEYSGDDTDVPALTEIRNALKTEGIISCGAVVPNYRGPMCYNNPEHMDILEKRVRSLAAVFDEIIVDDWLFTTCTCPKCFEGRGSRSWADYRTELVAGRSRERILGPAREVNPRVKVIVKYPNWYEGHTLNGYDVVRQTKQFDAVSIGIETRQRATHDQHIPIYSGYVFQKWLSSVEPGKWMSAWLDNYGMKGDENDYVAQVWQAVFARAPEIIFWEAGQLYPGNPSSDVYPHLVEMLPEFDRVAGLLKTPAKGAVMHLPYGSTGEYNIFGYFGMAGIPIAPTGVFPDRENIAIFTLHSLKEPNLAEKMIARLREKKDLYMTWELLRALQDTEFGNLLKLVDSEGSISSSHFRVRGFSWQPDEVRSDRPFTFPRISTTTWPYVRDVAAVREDYDFAVLMNVPYMDGTVYVLNVPENAYDLMRLPAPVIEAIRRPFLKQVGAQLLGAGEVGFYPINEKQFVLYSMSDQAVESGVRVLNASVKGWRERLHGKTLSIKEAPQRPGPPGAGEDKFVDVKLTLRPFEVVVLEAE